jgi:hypothetical protein
VDQRGGVSRCRSDGFQIAGACAPAILFSPHDN